MMFSNSSTELNRPSALTGAVICCSGDDGAEPMAPVANWTFWPRTDCSTSPALMRKLRSLSGFSQMRIEYEEPNWFAALTPAMRWMGSSTCEETRLLSSAEVALSLGERTPSARMKPSLTLETDRPCTTTSLGRRASASFTRFWVCRTATSASVPFSNTRVMAAVPFEFDDEVKYSRRSRPVSCCSMICVTVRSMVSAFAPGYTALIATCGGAMSG